MRKNEIITSTVGEMIDLISASFIMKLKTLESFSDDEEKGGFIGLDEAIERY